LLELPSKREPLEDPLLRRGDVGSLDIIKTHKAPPKLLVSKNHQIQSLTLLKGLAFRVEIGSLSPEAETRHSDKARPDGPLDGGAEVEAGGGERREKAGPEDRE